MVRPFGASSAICARISGYSGLMNTQKSRLSLTGYIALAIVLVVLAIGLLYVYRAVFPPV